MKSAIRRGALSKEEATARMESRDKRMINLMNRTLRVTTDDEEQQLPRPVKGRKVKKQKLENNDDEVYSRSTDQITRKGYTNKKDKLDFLREILEECICHSVVPSPLQDQTFARDREAILSALRENPEMDLSDGGLLWKIIGETNRNYHTFAHGRSFLFCRSGQINHVRDHEDYLLNKDYFLDMDSFANFALEQLVAYGDDVDRLWTLATSTMFYHHKSDTDILEEGVVEEIVNDNCNIKDIRRSRNFNEIRTAALMKASEVIQASPPKGLSEFSHLHRLPLVNESSVSMIERLYKTSDSIDDITTLYEKMKLARVALDIKSVETPIERNEEMDLIYGHIRQSLFSVEEGWKYGNTPFIHNLFVYGLPGIGKTLAVEKVLEVVKYQQGKKILPRCCVVDISGMEIHSDTFYLVIAARLGMKISNQSSAREKVLARFRNEGNDQEVIPTTILLIDEISNAPKKIIRELLEIIGKIKSVPTALPSSSSSSTSVLKASSISHSNIFACSLILIGISNRADFSVNIGISHNATNHLIVIPFRPYESNDLKSIVTRRSLGIFDSQSNAYIAGKVYRSEAGKTIKQTDIIH